jgi:hypothetical protein
MANTPLFRLQPGKRKLATRSKHVAVLTFTAAAVFVLYVACAFFLLADSATDDMQHRALSSSSKQHALGVWHGNRRLHMTFKHTKQLTDPRAAAEALRQRWAEFWASELPSGGKPAKLSMGSASSSIDSPIKTRSQVFLSQQRLNYVLILIAPAHNGRVQWRNPGCCSWFCLASDVPAARLHRLCNRLLDKRALLHALLSKLIFCCVHS